MKIRISKQLFKSKNIYFNGARICFSDELLLYLIMCNVPQYCVFRDTWGQKKYLLSGYLLDTRGQLCLCASVYLCWIISRGLWKTIASYDE